MKFCCHSSFPAQGDAKLATTAKKCPYLSLPLPFHVRRTWGAYKQTRTKITSTRTNRTPPGGNKSHLVRTHSKFKNNRTHQKPSQSSTAVSVPLSCESQNILFYFLQCLHTRFKKSCSLYYFISFEELHVQRIHTKFELIHNLIALSNL